jgi:hypothetical protein
MPGDENHFDVAIVLDSVLDDHGFDTPDMTLESAVAARRRWLRPIQLVDRPNRSRARLQVDESPLRIAERL